MRAPTAVKALIKFFQCLGRICFESQGIIRFKLDVVLTKCQRATNENMQMQMTGHYQI